MIDLPRQRERKRERIWDSMVFGSIRFRREREEERVNRKWERETERKKYLRYRIGDLFE